MSSVTVQEIRKTFGQVVALDDVSVDIRQGEMFFLLGPSGCGKTTLLRILAGFIEPEGGQLLFDDRPVLTVPPHRRNTGMVFQNYALWPHMTVRDNVAYGLKVRKVDRAERDRRVDRALELVRLGQLGARRPNELSGGQQQRVALARALVIEPELILLDEPLSNLDAKLRNEMRSEIRRIHDETGITTLYVTHDQKEALSMADRVAVIDLGKVVQVGTPRELYETPATRFVAEFIGETNVLPVVVGPSESDRMRIDSPVGSVAVKPGQLCGVSSGEAVMSIRPEALFVQREGAPSLGLDFQATVLSVTYLGEMEEIELRLPDGHRLSVHELHPKGLVLKAGDSIACTADPNDVMVFPR